MNRQDLEIQLMMADITIAAVAKEMLELRPSKSDNRYRDLADRRDQVIAEWHEIWEKLEELMKGE